MTGVRVLAHTPVGGTVLVAVKGDDLSVGVLDSALYQPVRLYHADRDELSQPLWLGSAVKFLGGYIEASALNPAREEHVRTRVAALLTQPERL